MTWQDPIQSPYDAKTQNTDSQTLPLAEIIKRAIQAQLLGMRVMMPCKVVKVNANKNVDVQPGFKTRYIDGSVEDHPVIQNCPVGTMQGQGYSIKPPIEVGDTGYLIFADRNMDAWLAGDGSTQDPQDVRMHDLSDAMFVPGLVPFAQQTTDATTDFVFKNGLTTFTIGKDRIAMKRGGAEYTAVLGEPLTAILVSIINQFNMHVHIGNLGAPTTVPTVPMDVPDLDDLKHLAKVGEGF